jgi:CrcB protein
MVRTLLLIGLGGGLGSGLRYLTTVVLQRYYSSIFPLATWVTNLIGCFLIGLIIGILDKNEMANSDYKWFLITGFCGGYTTFSAFGYENINLMQNNNFGLSFLYISLSVISGLFAVWLGLFISK